MEPKERVKTTDVLIAIKPPFIEIWRNTTYNEADRELVAKLSCVECISEEELEWMKSVILNFISAAVMNEVRILRKEVLPPERLVPSERGKV